MNKHLNRLLEKCVENGWYDGHVIDGDASEVEKALLEFGKQCFEAGREFNSKDGTVDIDVVIFYKGADNSDLEPKFPLFEDYLISLENKTQD